MKRLLVICTALLLSSTLYAGDRKESGKLCPDKSIFDFRIGVPLKQEFRTSLTTNRRRSMKTER
jgi:hypothetical protein